MLGVFQKQIIDHFKGTFPAKIEAYLNNVSDINTTIKVARDVVQTFKKKLPSQAD